MNASDDPDRNHPQRLRSRLCTSWSRAARSAHAAHASTLPAVVLNVHAKRAARACLEHLSQNTKALDAFESRVLAAEIAVVSDAQILELNASYRGKNKPTDVLSFSQIEGEAFPDFGDEIVLGDVVISIETAHRQARELNHDLDYEIAFLIIHGVLHLCGFDHDTATRRRVMWKLQDTIIEEMMARA